MSVARTLLRILVSGLVVTAAAGCTAEEVVDTSSVASIEAPSRSVAGAPIDVSVGVVGDGEIRLEIVDAYASSLLVRTVVSSDDSVTFSIPGPVTESGGLVTFRASGGNGDAVVAETMIEPTDLADPLEVVVGPRTVVADGADETMAVVFATDRFGNPLPDGTSLDVVLIDEGGRETSLATTIDGGVAGRRIASGTVAQSVDVFASDPAGDIASSRRGFDEVAGPAAAVELAVVGSIPEADGRSSITLRTGVVADRFGNVVPDGRLVSLRSDGPDGVGQLTARTIGGVAEFDMTAPARPGPVTVTPIVDEVRGEPIVIDVASAISELPVTVDPTDPSGARVSVGPVLDADGALAADGTTVAVSVLLDGVLESSSEAPLLDGRATVDIAPVDDDGAGRQVIVDVLGEVGTREWTR